MTARRRARAAAQLLHRPRAAGVAAGDVDAALTDERSVVVAWLMRGTLHRVGRDNYRWLELDRDAALAELARRYLTGHAPATPTDLASWSGLPLRDVRAGLQAIASDDAARDPAPDAIPARLLPAFDPYLLRPPRYQWTPFMRLAIATCSIDAFSLGSFSPRDAAESGKTL
jgi:hypothetical protein